MLTDKFYMFKTVLNAYLYKYLLFLYTWELSSNKFRINLPSVILKD